MCYNIISDCEPMSIEREVVGVDQRKIVPVVYGILVAVAAFVLGYFAGTSVPDPQIQVITTEVQQASAADVPEVSAEQEETAERINLNTATQQDLETLPGIGPVLAERILKYRAQVGRFVSKEQLMDVEGIGQIRYDNLEHLITVEVTP